MAFFFSGGENLAQKFTGTDKKVSKMTKDGLREKNLRDVPTFFKLQNRRVCSSLKKYQLSHSIFISDAPLLSGSQQTSMM